MKAILIAATLSISSFALATTSHEVHKDHNHAHGNDCGHAAEWHHQHGDHMHETHN